VVGPGRIREYVTNHIPSPLLLLFGHPQPSSGKD
jgi:hypothetical protein